MQNDNVSSNINLRWLFGISAAGMVVFAGLYLWNPRVQTETVTKSITTTVTNIVTNTITNVVVKEVPKEVEKIVRVPAAIPQEYIAAMQAVSNLVNCDFVKDNQVLFGIKDVQVICFLTDATKQCVSDDEVRTRFELTLRKNGVPVNPTSKNYVQVIVEGLWDNNRWSITFSVRVRVLETQTLIRGGEAHKASVTVWEKSSYGFAGSIVANSGLLHAVDEQGEIFANDFLAANPKQ